MENKIQEATGTEAVERKKDFKKTLLKIAENYGNLEQSLVNQLFLATPNHPLTTGTYRETVWKSLFERIIPRKFCIDQGVFIMDSEGSISNEVDLVIFDEQYTPYIFNYGKIKFIPIEAVAVVVQCKSAKLKPENLGLWVKSIEDLKTSLNSVARVMSGVVDNSLEETYRLLYGSEDKDKGKHTKTQTATRPIRILCSTTKGEISPEIIRLFDISLSVDGTHLKKTISPVDENYQYWYEELNHYDLKRFGENQEKYQAIMKKAGSFGGKTLEGLKIKEKNGEENVIMSLIFQLNQMLMLINNPMLFPHEAYARMFNELQANWPNE